MSCHLKSCGANVLRHNKSQEIVLSANQDSENEKASNFNKLVSSK